MKNQLSNQQISFYRDNGFLVVPGFLDANELAAWRDGVEEAVHSRGDSRLPPSAAADNPIGQHPNSKGNDYASAFLQALNLWMTNEKMRRIMLDPRLGKMAADLSGADGIRIWHDQALIKRPWDNYTGWHIDNFFWSFTSPQAISIWVALDDATYQNGCLYFLPGTHKLARVGENGNIGAMGAIFKTYPEWAKIESAGAPMKAGDCSFHSGWLAHGAGLNMTPGYRRAMTCAYMPEGATFNGQQNILTRAQVAKLKIGDVMEDDEQNPLIYSKVRPQAMVTA